MEPEPLPPPDPDALAHSNRLKAKIINHIAAHGALHFDQYWEQVLYQPGLGYYSAGAQIFGARGDFVTAPELGSVFARCLAQQCAATLKQLGGGNLLEIGAGSGALCGDVLLALEAMGPLPARYQILERSADLRQRQAALLAARCPHLASRVEWLEAPPQQSWQGLILGNEVVDALAPRRFRRGPDAWMELKVAATKGELGYLSVAAEPADQQRLQQLEAQLPEPLPADYCTEIQPGVAAWMKSIAATLERGLALLIDYGYSRAEYYHPQRVTGTLICHYRHRAHDDPFQWPGLQDLSVNVDFTALAEAMDAAGLSVVGFTPQAAFLVANGLQELLAQNADLPTAEQLQLNRQAMQLTSPSAMGERFHVLAGTRGVEGTPRGFRDCNRLNRL